MLRRCAAGSDAWLLAHLNGGHAEPDAAAPVGRAVAAAVPRAAVPGPVDPAPATVHAGRVLFADLGINSSRQRLFMPVATPFPDVALHVVQAPGIGTLTTHLVRGEAGV